MARRTVATRCLAAVPAVAALLLVVVPHTAADVKASTASCPVSHVHYSPDTTAASGLRVLPWLATAPAGRFHAYLFFYGATPWPKLRLPGARIFTTAKARSVNPKVLWIPQRAGAGPTILISGKRLDKPGHFASRYPRASSGNEFPSYVEVPKAGCWRVTVTSGKLVGVVTFVAIDSF